MSEPRTRGSLRCWVSFFSLSLSVCSYLQAMVRSDLSIFSCTSAEAATARARGSWDSATLTNRAGKTAGRACRSRALTAKGAWLIQRHIHGRVSLLRVSSPFCIAIALRREPWLHTRNDSGGAARCGRRDFGICGNRTWSDQSCGRVVCRCDTGDFVAVGHATQSSCGRSARGVSVEGSTSGAQSSEALHYDCTHR